MADHKNLAEALAAVQAELPKVGKGNRADVKSDKGSYSYRYADLADINQAILPLLGKHGLSFTAMPTLDESGRFVLAYRLQHANGDALQGVYPLPSSGRPQEVGSAITYARRYCLCAVTGIAADEDDDGKAAQATTVRPERHEASWDPAEQEQLREAYEAEIEQATDGDAITEIGKRVRSARGKTLSPATYDHLATVAGQRRAVLAGGA